MCFGVLPSKASQATQFFCCQEKSWLCGRWKKTHEVSLNFFLKISQYLTLFFCCHWASLRITRTLWMNLNGPPCGHPVATLCSLPYLILLYLQTFITWNQIEYSERVGKIVWRFVNVRLCWPYCFCCYFCRNCQFWNLNILYGATTGKFVKHSIANSPSYPHLWLKEGCVSQQDHAKGVSQKEAQYGVIFSCKIYLRKENSLSLN